MTHAPFGVLKCLSLPMVFFSLGLSTLGNSVGTGITVRRHIAPLTINTVGLVGPDTTTDVFRRHSFDGNGNVYLIQTTSTIMDRMFPPAPAPKTNLGRYRQLSTLAAVHVSPIQLGAMSIGDQWEQGFGAMNKETSFALLDAYFDNGGNFIDTASAYQNESSEKFIGEWAEKRGIRDQLFIATKYSIGYKTHDPSIQQKIQFSGNNLKSMHVSIRDSLAKLRTSYIDLFYVHVYDHVTGVEELMRGLHTLVLQGKVLYLGISDTPAWVVSKANMYAKLNGLTPFSVYQGHWNVMDRAFERDIIPMARAEGMALAPWGVLGSGKLRTDAEEQRRRDTGEKGRTILSSQWERDERETKMSHALEKVANEVGAKHITSVAIAYLMHRTPFVFPIIGGRKIEHLLSNIEALEISLSPEQMAYIESILPLSLDFPGNIIGTGETYSVMMSTNAVLDKAPLQQPVPAAKKIAH